MTDTEFMISILTAWPCYETQYARAGHAFMCHHVDDDTRQTIKARYLESGQNSIATTFIPLLRDTATMDDIYTCAREFWAAVIHGWLRDNTLLSLRQAVQVVAGRHTHMFRARDLVEFCGHEFDPTYFGGRLRDDNEYE